MRILFLLLLAVSLDSKAQQVLGKLTVEKIMRDPLWIGSSPSNPAWSIDGKTLFFSWNPTAGPADSLYYINLDNKVPVKASLKQKQELITAADIVYNKKRT